MFDSFNDSEKALFANFSEALNAFLTAQNANIGVIEDTLEACAIFINMTNQEQITAELAAEKCVEMNQSLSLLNTVKEDVEHFWTHWLTYFDTLYQENQQTVESLFFTFITLFQQKQKENKALFVGLEQDVQSLRSVYQDLYLELASPVYEGTMATTNNESDSSQFPIETNVVLPSFSKDPARTTHEVIKPRVKKANKENVPFQYQELRLTDDGGASIKVSPKDSTPEKKAQERNLSNPDMRFMPAARNLNATFDQLAQVTDTENENPSPF